MTPSAIILVAAVICVDCVILGSTRADLMWGALDWVAIQLTLFAGIGLILAKGALFNWQRPTMRLRIIVLMQVFSFMTLASVSLRILNHLSMFIGRNMPFQDHALAALDRGLGWDFPAYLAWVNAQPIVLQVLDWSYGGLDSLVATATAILVLAGHHLQAKRFIHAFLWAGFICVGLGWIAPTLGTISFYESASQGLSNFALPPGLTFISHQLYLRETAGIIHIDPHSLPGLAAVPSLHAGAAILLICTFWPTRVFWPIVVYSVTMLAATPIFGLHYMIDLWAGGGVAAGAYYAAWRSYRPYNIPGTT